MNVLSIRGSVIVSILLLLLNKVFIQILHSSISESDEMKDFSYLLYA